MHGLEDSAAYLMRNYGYHAVPFALLADPAGVPWAWIFLMLLADEAGKNVPLMLFYGFLVLMAFDHVLYWIGALGGRPLLEKLERKRPKWREKIEAGQQAVIQRGELAVIFGRYLPIAGRYMGIGIGLAGVRYLKFAIYDAIGAALTVYGFGLTAWLFGRKFVTHPLFHEVLLIAVVVGTIGTTLVVWLQARGKKSVE